MNRDELKRFLEIQRKKGLGTSKENRIDLRRGYIGYFGSRQLFKLDLSYTDLSDRDLSSRDLQDTNLTGANLWRTSLISSNLRNVNFTEAELAQACFAGTFVEGIILPEEYKFKPGEMVTFEGETLKQDFGCIARVVEFNIRRYCVVKTTRVKDLNVPFTMLKKRNFS